MTPCSARTRGSLTGAKKKKGKRHVVNKRQIHDETMVRPKRITGSTSTFSELGQMSQ